MAEVSENCSDIPHLSTREIEALYSSSLYSIIHRLGVKGEKATPPKQQLFLYLQSVLDISKDNHESHLEAVEQTEPPLSVLTVTVLGAKDLVPKDSNGLSDPFCMMGCIPSDSRRTGVSAASCVSKDLRALLLEKHLAPELVKVTSIKKKTLNPIWNESYEFEIENTDSNVFQLEVWDQDEATTMADTIKAAGKVPDLKGFGRLFKEVAKTSRKGSTSLNDFEGVAVIPLNSIPCNGMEDWFPLQGKTPKKYYGEVKLRFHWTHRNFEHAMHILSADQALQTLWYKCVHYEASSRKKQNPKDDWNGQLSPLGKSLLLQYAVQHAVPVEEQAVSQWIAYSQSCCLPVLQYTTIHSLLQQLSCSSKPVIKEKDKPIVRGGLYRFISISVSRLEKQRSLFPGNDVDAMVRLSVMLKCLNESFILDKGLQLKLYQAGIKPSIVAAIKADCCARYLTMKSDAEKMVDGNDPSRAVTCLARLTEAMREHVRKDLGPMAHVYKQVVSLDFIDILHRQFGELVMQDVRSALQDASKANLSLDESLDASSSLFQLYQALKTFDAIYICEDSSADPTPTAKFYLVFKKTVERWFHLTKQESMERIKKAVELDQMNTMDSMVKHSTSAVDVMNCISLFSAFWNKLGWPDPSGEYVFATCVTDYICDCALEYGRLIHQKLTVNGFYDTEGRFDVTDQLCIAINNLEEVRQGIANLYEALHLDGVVARLEKEHGQQSRMTCERTLATMLDSADEDIRNRIGKIVCHACKLMKRDIHKCIEDIVLAPTDVSGEKVVVPILEYMDSNLITLHSFVVENNFKRILGELWLVVLEEIQIIVNSRSMNLHEHSDCVRRVLASLKILQDFFHADGKGLEADEMQGEEYSQLRMQLENFLVPTPELIQNLYQAKLLEQEEMEDEPLGRISVQCAFNKKTQKLQVQVMNATNLKPLDSNGQSDPFVKVQLKPLHLFPDLPTLKTKVQKKTLHPIFDELFEFDVTPEQCLLPGACIQFRIMDQDFLKSEVEGEVFVSLNEVKGLTEKLKGTLNDLPTLSPPLMSAKDQDKTSQILETLKCRQNDKEAQDFWKGWTKRHKQKDR